MYLCNRIFSFKLFRMLTLDALGSDEILESIWLNEEEITFFWIKKRYIYIVFFLDFWPGVDGLFHFVKFWTFVFWQLFKKVKQFRRFSITTYMLRFVKINILKIQCHTLRHLTKSVVTNYSFSQKNNGDFFTFFSIAWQMVIEENIGGLKNCSERFFGSRC